MPTHKDAKAMAKFLRDALADRNLALSHGECLDIVARQLGCADWNTLSARLTLEEERTGSQGHPDAAQEAPSSEQPSGALAEGVPVLPLRDVVVYPEVTLPLYLARPKSLRAVETAMRRGKRVMLVTQRQPDVHDPASSDLYEVGTLARILNVSSTPEGMKVMVSGISRGHLDLFHPGDPASARITLLSDVLSEGGADMEALHKDILRRFERHAQLNGLAAKLPAGAPPLADILAGLGRLDPGTFADTMAARMQLRLAQKQEVLEMLDIRKRLEYMDALTKSWDAADAADAAPK